MALRFEHVVRGQGAAGPGVGLPHRPLPGGARAARRRDHREGGRADLHGHDHRQGRARSPRATRARCASRRSTPRRGTAEIAASGQDTSGRGGADMKMTSRLVERAPGETEVNVVSEVNVTGILAQFGRGLIQDVSNQMFERFTEAMRRGAGDAAGPATPRCRRDRQPWPRRGGAGPAARARPGRPRPRSAHRGARPSGADPGAAAAPASAGLLDRGRGRDPRRPVLVLVR